jgi:hypothetical protein
LEKGRNLHKVAQLVSGKALTQTQFLTNASHDEECRLDNTGKYVGIKGRDDGGYILPKSILSFYLVLEKRVRKGEDGRGEKGRERVGRGEEDRGKRRGGQDRREEERTGEERRGQEKRGEVRRGEERRGEERRDNQQTYEENHMKQTQISQQQKVFCSCDTGGKGGTKRRAVNGNSVSQPQVCVCPTNRILEDSPDHSKL